LATKAADPGAPAAGEEKLGRVERLEDEAPFDVVVTPRTSGDAQRGSGTRAEEGMRTSAMGPGSETELT